MLILSAGHLQQEVLYEASCLSCHCRVQFQEKEAELVPSNDQRDRDSVKVKCPTEGCTDDIVAERICNTTPR